MSSIMFFATAIIVLCFSPQIFALLHAYLMIGYKCNLDTFDQSIK